MWSRQAILDDSNFISLYFQLNLWSRCEINEDLQYFMYHNADHYDPDIESVIKWAEKRRTRRREC